MLATAPSPAPRVPLSPQERAKKLALLKVVERTLKIKQAKDDLISLAELLMPSPSDPDDVNQTRYDAQVFHRALAKALMEVEAGDYQKLIITMPPRHGKSEMASKTFPAWFVGRDPYRHVMVASYNQPFANDFGKAVRDIMSSEVYRKVFPDTKLKRGSKAADRLQTESGGVLAFVGRGGSITGRGANLFIIDDPIKNSKEANSETIREECWTWFNNDVLSRGMDDMARMLIIMTRWHEDDLVGRLTDPENVHYNADEAREWKIINIPALCEDETSDVEKALGRKKGDALWPWVHKWVNGERIKVPKIRREWLLGRQRQDPRGFASLYQQRPTPMDGDLIKDEMIKTYLPRERPPEHLLRIYASSDHAAEEKTNNDYNVILIVGVDKDDNIWVLDCWWERAASDRVVEKMIDKMARWKPITWYMEREHIVKTIGPFLKKRMRERKVYCVINDKMSAHTADKVGKAQSIMGRMSMGMVLFPKNAPWFDKARTQMLKFPKATHDDFVDALSVIGRALAAMLTGSKAPEDKKEPVAGTWGFFTAQRKVAERQAARNKNLRGM